MLVWPSSQRIRKRGGLLGAPPHSSHRLGDPRLRLDDDQVSRLCASFLCSPPSASRRPTLTLDDHADEREVRGGNGRLRPARSRGGGRYALLPHARTESAVAEAEALEPRAGRRGEDARGDDSGGLRAGRATGLRADRLAQAARGSRRRQEEGPPRVRRRDLARTTRSSTWARCHRSAEAGATRLPSSTAAWPSAPRSCWRRGRTRSPCAWRPLISCASPKLKSPTSAWACAEPDTP